MHLAGALKTKTALAKKKKKFPRIFFYFSFRFFFLSGALKTESAQVYLTAYAAFNIFEVIYNSASLIGLTKLIGSDIIRTSVKDYI